MIAKTMNDGGYTTVKPNLLGFAERDVIDVEEARRAFDFRIAKCPSYNSRGEILDGVFHLERGDTGDQIPTWGIGSKFEPVQHSDVFDMIINNVMPAVPDMRLETVGTLYGSGTGFVSAKMGDSFSLPGDTSPNNMRLTFINPCGRGSLILGFTSVRVFCQNCIRAAQRDMGNHGAFVVRHTVNAVFAVQGALTAIAAQAEEAAVLRARSERLARVSVVQRHIDAALDRVYPLDEAKMSAPSLAYNRAAREEVEFQFAAGPTAQTFTEDNGWKLLNAFTYPVFNPLRMKKNTDIADVAFKGQFGQRAEKVTRMLEAVEGVVLAAA